MLDNNAPAFEAVFGSVHTYYEKLVYEQLWRASDRAKNDANFMADALCVAAAPIRTPRR